MILPASASSNGRSTSVLDRFKRRRRATAEEQIATLFLEANGPLHEIVRSGPDLEDALYDGIACRGHMLVLGLPGCGKTHNAEAAARRARDDGLIGRWVLIPATKDLVGETLFDPQLRLDAKDPERYVRIDPAVVVELVGRDALLPADEYDRTRALRTWRPEQWVCIILDECTRASAQFIDHLLSVLEHFVIVVDGRNYRVPIVWIFLGNPPSMDSTTTVLTPAFYSRLFRRINLLDVDVDTQADIITAPRLVLAAELAGHPDRARPTPDHIRLAAGIRFLTWGLPLDRKGLTWLPESARRLIAEAASLDPTLRLVMEEIGKLEVFGPDSRRVTAWLLAAQAHAVGRGGTFDDQDLKATIQSCLQLGSKDTFTEGNAPQKMALKTRCLFLIAHHALANPRVRELLLRRTDPRALAQQLAPVLFAGGDTESLTLAMAEAFADHRRRLMEGRHPDVESRTRAMMTFFHRVAQVNSRLNPDEIAEAVLRLADRGAYPGEALLEGGRFVASADRWPIAALAAAGVRHLSPLGRAVAGLQFLEVPPDGPPRARPALVSEQARLAVLPYPHARQFEPELTDAATRKPDLEARLPDLAALLEAVLGAEELGAAVAQGEDAWDSRFGSDDDQTRAAALDCVRSVAARVVFERQEWFRRLLEQVEARR